MHSFVISKNHYICQYMILLFIYFGFPQLCSCVSLNPRQCKFCLMQIHWTWCIWGSYPPHWMRFTIYCSDLENITSMMQVCKGSTFEPWGTWDVFHTLSGKDKKSLNIFTIFFCAAVSVHWICPHWGAYVNFYSDTIGYITWVWKGSEMLA